MAEDQNASNSESPSTSAQPGMVISPDSKPSASTPTAPAAPAPNSAPPAPEPESTPSAEPAQPAVQSDQIAKATPIASDNNDDPQDIAWTASEFIHHDKSSSWYVGLAVATVLLAAIAYLLTRGLVSVAVIIVAGIVMGIYGSHTPQELEYRIDRRGITVGQKTRTFDEFRSFAVVPEGAFSSIVFMPLKRFAVSLSIYFAPQDEERIVALLSDQLPFEGHQHDAIESLMRRIRF